MKRNLSPKAFAHQKEQQKAWAKANMVKVFTSLSKEQVAKFDEMVKPLSRYSAIKALLEMYLNGEIEFKKPEE